jgi:hypothetical protein
VTRLVLDDGAAPPGPPGGPALHVVVDSLEEAAAQLDRTRDAVAQFSGRPTGWSGMVTEAGDTGMAEAIESFIHRWSYGLTCLHTDVGSLSRAVRAAADAYARIEAAIVAGCGG